MPIKLFLILTFYHCVLLTRASDLRVVPSAGSAANYNDDQVVPDLRNGASSDQVVPRLYSAPLTNAEIEAIRSSLMDAANEDSGDVIIMRAGEQFSSEEEDDDKFDVPTPRARVEEPEESVRRDSNTSPTPRPRIVEEEPKPEPARTARASLEKEDQGEEKVLHDEVGKYEEVAPASTRPEEDDEKVGSVGERIDELKPKPPVITYRFNSSPKNSPDSWKSPIESKEGQPEELLSIDDLDTPKELSTSEEDVRVASEDSDTSKVVKDDEKESGKKDVPDEDIERYIQELDEEYRMKNENQQQQQVKDKVVDRELGLRKYIVSDGPTSQDFPSIPKILKRREVTYNQAIAPPPPQQQQKQPVDSKIPPIGGEKISNERKTSGGLSYNVNFDEEKAAAEKPKLSSTHTKRALNVNLVSDTAQQLEPMESRFVDWSNSSKPAPHSNDSDWFASVESDSRSLASSESASESAEGLLVRPDPQLLNLADSSSASHEKTFSEPLHKIVRDPKVDDQVYRQDLDRLPHRGPTIKNSLAIDPTASSSSEEESKEFGILVLENTVILDALENQTRDILDSSANGQKDEADASFWQQGFTVGVHVSPLTMCLVSGLILMIVLLRFALKYQKKRLIHASNAHHRMEDGATQAYDSDSLKTVITN